MDIVFDRGNYQRAWLERHETGIAGVSIARPDVSDAGLRQFEHVVG
jgi:hypothetical protein